MVEVIIPLSKLYFFSNFIFFCTKLPLRPMRTDREHLDEEETSPKSLESAISCFAFCASRNPINRIKSSSRQQKFSGGFKTGLGNSPTSGE